MKKNILFIILFFFFKAVYSQIPAPDIYCNGLKVESDEIQGYFLPILFEFKFNNKDTIYNIKEGTIEFQSYVSKAPLNFKSNLVYTNFVIVGQDVTITINAVEILVNNKLIKVDRTPFSKKIKLNHNKEITKKEIEIVNNNEGIVFLNNQIFNEYDALSFNQDSTFTLSLSFKKDLNITEEVNEFETILVRGNRPVATNNFKTNSGSLDNFKTAAIKGDFIWIKAKGKKDVLFNKLLLVK